MSIKVEHAIAATILGGGGALVAYDIGTGPRHLDLSEAVAMRTQIAPKTYLMPVPLTIDGLMVRGSESSMHELFQTYKDQNKESTPIGIVFAYGLDTYTVNVNGAVRFKNFNVDQRRMWGVVFEDDQNPDIKVPSSMSHRFGNVYSANISRGSQETEEETIQDLADSIKKQDSKIDIKYIFDGWSGGYCPASSSHELYGTFPGLEGTKPIFFLLDKQ